MLHARLLEAQCPRQMQALHRRSLMCRHLALQRMHCELKVDASYFSRDTDVTWSSSATGDHALEKTSTLGTASQLHSNHPRHGGQFSFGQILHICIPICNNTSESEYMPKLPRQQSYMPLYTLQCQAQSNVRMF